MKSNASAIIFIFAFFCATAVISINAQDNPSVGRTADAVNLNLNTNSLEIIAKQLEAISQSVADLNQRLKKFSETFSSNQGLRLSDKEQKLLAAFEFLNRAETRLATLQKLKIELAEKKVSVSKQISKNEEEAKPESIDRNIAFRGTTTAEDLRENRRRALDTEHSEFLTLLRGIQNSLDDTNEEIRQTDAFLKNLRRRIFPEIEKDLADL